MLAVVALAVVATVLLVAGIRKNAQIDSLRSDPVSVDLTVTRCIALLGGSGSNTAGYECTGTYTVDGRHYTEGVPGSTLYPVGATVHGIVAASDPGLFSTAGTVAAERAAPARGTASRRRYWWWRWPVGRGIAIRFRRRGDPRPPGYGEP